MKTLASWDDFEFCVSKIVGWIKRHERQYNGVYGIPRGGLPLAIRLSHELDIPLLAGGVTEKSLVVDDIADTGNAIRPYMERCKCDVITLYRSKHCDLWPTYHVFSAENWVVFPWEKGDENAA